MVPLRVRSLRAALSKRGFSEGRGPMYSFLFYSAAAVAEIAGCFAFWAWLRLEKPVWWVVPGTGFLVLFAYLLTRVDSDYAGRAYAAYGGIYITAALLWQWLIEAKRPDHWDVTGATVCLVGAAIILLGPRPA